MIVTIVQHLSVLNATNSTLKNGQNVNFRLCMSDHNKKVVLLTLKTEVKGLIFTDLLVTGHFFFQEKCVFQTP